MGFPGNRVDHVHLADRRSLRSARHEVDFLASRISRRGIGALAGQAIGGDTGATLIGAGAGAIIGGGIGNSQDNNE